MDPVRRRSGPLGDYRVRLCLYLALQAAVFLAPGPAVLAPSLAIWALGRTAGMRWGRWLKSAPWVLILLPALAGLPEALAAPISLHNWLPALRRSFVFLLVLASSQWFTRSSGVTEMQAAFSWALRPLGAAGNRAALAATLTVIFLPWARSELRETDEALRLRGRSAPLPRLAALGVPLTTRLLEKARHTSEALSLRTPTLFSEDEAEGSRPTPESRSSHDAPCARRRMD